MRLDTFYLYGLIYVYVFLSCVHNGFVYVYIIVCMFILCTLLVGGNKEYLLTYHFSFILYFDSVSQVNCQKKVPNTTSVI